MLPRHTLRMAFAAGLLTVLKASLGLLIAATKQSSGPRSYSYSTATVPFLAELAKLLFSLCCLFRQRRRASALARGGMPAYLPLLPAAAADAATDSGGCNAGCKKTAIAAGTERMPPTPWVRALHSLYFVAPSVVYWLLNNVQFATLRYLNPTTYQVLSNLKIVTTGLIFRVVLGRTLSPLQWIALLLLMIGTTISQVSSSCSDNTGSAFDAPWQGYMYGLASAVLSAVGAVSTEWLLKRGKGSLYEQNVQLYGYGTIVNGLYLVAASSASASSLRGGGTAGGWMEVLSGGAGGGGWGLGPGGMLAGYDATTWAIVANLAFSGLLVSWIMKYADSILKVYSTSLAVVLTMLASVAWFDLHVSLQLVLGVVTASLSLALYYLPPSLLAPPSPSHASAAAAPSSSSSSLHIWSAAAMALPGGNKDGDGGGAPVLCGSAAATARHGKAGAARRLSYTGDADGSVAAAPSSVAFGAGGGPSSRQERGAARTSHVSHVL